jgi:hypothetical protein
MTNDDYVDKILAGVFQSAARRQSFGEPREPSLTCEICRGTGWDVWGAGRLSSRLEGRLIFQGALDVSNIPTCMGPFLSSGFRAGHIVLIS